MTLCTGKNNKNKSIPQRRNDLKRSNNEGVLGIVKKKGR